MPENVRAMVLKEPGKYELRSFPYPKPQKGCSCCEDDHVRYLRDRQTLVQGGGHPVRRNEE